MATPPPTTTSTSSTPDASGFDPVKLAGNGDRVDRVATAVQDGHGGVDTSVCGAVEVVLTELAEDDGQGVG